MKKTLLKISLLSLAFVSLITFVVRTNAASSPVAVSLAINAGTLSCSNTGVALAALSTSYNAQQQTWTFTSALWTCTDNRWTAWGAPWAQTVVLSTALNSTWAWTPIPAANVKMKATVSTTQWNLAWASTMATYVAINSAQDVYRKSSTNTGAIGVEVWDLWITVDVPANQTPGLYTGTITVTDPS